MACGCDDVQGITVLAGEPAGKIPRPWFPPRLNVTGIASPPLTRFTTGGLSTGAKNPEKWIGTEKLSVFEPPKLAEACSVTGPPLDAVTVFVATPAAAATDPVPVTEPPAPTFANVTVAAASAPLVTRFP